MPYSNPITSAFCNPSNSSACHWSLPEFRPRPLTRMRWIRCLVSSPFPLPWLKYVLSLLQLPFFYKIYPREQNNSLLHSCMTKMMRLCCFNKDFYCGQSTVKDKKAPCDSAAGFTLVYLRKCCSTSGLWELFGHKSCDQSLEGFLCVLLTASVETWHSEVKKICFSCYFLIWISDLHCAGQAIFIFICWRLKVI